MLGHSVSRYTWIIDADKLHDTDPSAFPKSDAGTYGPRNFSPIEIGRLRKSPNYGTRFRMYDDDGELYYEGRIAGDFDGLEPLDDYGMPNAGCTRIELLSKDGKTWAIV